MHHYLGIDMGGTATRWVLVDAAGAEVGRGAVGGASAHLFNAAARAALVAVLRDIAGQVPGPLAGLHAGLTGHDDGAGDAARALFAQVFGTRPAAIAITDDVELAFHAAFAPGAGHLIVAGTGSVGLSIAQDGRITRVGGRGMLIDDAGSASWIALRALEALFQAEDRDGDFRAAPTLAQALWAAMGGQGWPGARTFVYGADRGRIGTLARAVDEAAQAGDPVARAVLIRAGQELARLAQVLVARCGPGPVAVVGGVARAPLVIDSLARALPGIALATPPIDAALTAAHLARAKAPA